MQSKVYSPLGVGAGSVIADDYEAVQRLTGDSKSVTFEAVERTSRDFKVLRLFAPEVTSPSVDTRAIMEDIVAARDVALPSLPILERIVKTQKQELCLVYGHFEGRALSEILTRVNDHSVEETVYLLCGIARALRDAQNRSLSHLHLRPSEIFLTNSSDILVCGYGCGRIYRGAEGIGHEGAYAAPEQRSGALGDSKSDVFSLGLIGYELLMGTAPDRTVQVEADFPVPSLMQISNSERTNWLASVIDEALQIPLGKRTINIEKFHAELKAHLPQAQAQAKQFYQRAKQERERLPAGGSAFSGANPQQTQVILLIGGIVLILVFIATVLTFRKPSLDTPEVAKVEAPSIRGEAKPLLETILTARSEHEKVERAMSVHAPDLAESIAATMKAKAKLPTTVDEGLVWVDVIATTPNSLTLVYTTDPATQAMFDKAAATFDSDVARTACGTKAFMNLMDGGYRITYMLLGIQGRSGKTVDVTLQDCGLQPLQ